MSESSNMQSSLGHITEIPLARPLPGSITATGTFKNYNTIDEFKAADKTVLFSQEAQKVYPSLPQPHTSSRYTHDMLRFGTKLSSIATHPN